MLDVVIRAERLGKRYLIGHQAEGASYDTLRESTMRTLSRFRRSVRDMAKGRALIMGDDIEEFWALKDIDFEIRRGEVVGIIGRNGAGKSTLLKVLSRITEPSEGRVTIDGRVASLLEVGTGFHPELSGRENIYLNGSILGMTRKEIQAKFDEIVEFAGVEKFLDTPVKRYSSGMKVRLGFSVAAHLEPEILIVDEVLAVGDAEFQKRCMGKMQDVAGHGRTVLFVSHNMAAIQALCPRSILLEAGYATADGDTKRLAQTYLSFGTNDDLILSEDVDRNGSGRVRFVSLNTHSSPQTGRPLRLTMNLSNAVPGLQARVSVLFSDMNGQPIMLLSSELPRDTPPLTRCDELEVNVPRLTLTPGRYYLTLFLEIDGVVSDWIDKGTTITIAPGDFYGGGKLVPSNWNRSVQLVDHQWSARLSRSEKKVV